MNRKCKGCYAADLIDDKVTDEKPNRARNVFWFLEGFLLASRRLHFEITQKGD